MTTRKTKSPIAIISERNATQRAVTSPGVAAVSESDGILNLRAGPVRADRERERAADRMAVDGDHAPDDEVPPLPQMPGWYIELIPAFADERRGAPAVSEWASASVTETIANRGSTASEYTSEPAGGGVSTTTLADGVVRSSASVRERGRGQRQRRGGDRAEYEAASIAPERERRRQHVTADEALEKQAPRSGDGHENADGQLAGGRGRSRYLCAASRPWIPRSGRTDVRVEVVERPCAGRRSRGQELHTTV